MTEDEKARVADALGASRVVDIGTKAGGPLDLLALAARRPDPTSGEGDHRD